VSLTSDHSQTETQEKEKMKKSRAVAKSFVVQDASWEQAVQKVLAQTQQTSVDLALLFASGLYEEHFAEIVSRVRRETGASVLIGSSGRGIIGMGQEFESEPALSLLTLSLPQSILRPERLAQHMVESCVSPKAWQDALAVPLEEIRAWFVLADPFSMDCQSLIDGLTQAYLGVPVFGCLTSNTIPKRHSCVFLNDEVFATGGVGLAIGGPYTLCSTISQGCRPVGHPWMITSIRENGFVETLSDLPAFEALTRALLTLPQDMRQKALINPIVGLAAHGQEDELNQKEMLLRGILRADPRQGWLAFGADTWVGQKIQFQMRDADIAGADLKESLEQLYAKCDTTHPLAGILCSCHSRGETLFEMPDHDAKMVVEQFGPLAVTGLFCNGSVSSEETRPMCRAFAASLALLMEGVL
jgi:small ligand-binding sensory domain FIST